MNISSAIVHAQPGHAEVVRRALAAIAGVEIHAVSDEGKLIITIESPGDRETADTFEAISQMDHVMFNLHGLPPDRRRTRNRNPAGLRLASPTAGMPQLH